MIRRTVSGFEKNANKSSHHRPLAPASSVLAAAGFLIAAFGVWCAHPAFAEDKPNAIDSTKTATTAPLNPSKRGAIGLNLYGTEDHVLVSKVVPKSPAERAGLQVGDEIRYFHGERTHTVQGLMDEISACQPGTRAEVVIRRGGQRQVIQTDVTSFASLYGDKVASAPAGNPAAVAPVTLPQRTMSPETARRMRVLELQIARLQQEMETLKSTPYVPQPVPTTTFDINSWLEQHRRGENGGDPSLFQ